MNLPEKYIESMKKLIGEAEFDRYLKSFNEKRTNGLRINTSKISVEDFMKINPFHLTPIPWIPNGFYYEEDDNPTRHPYYYAGLYYVQEPSAMTPANVLPVTPGDRILDLCAAPGGKSTELGVRLMGQGLLVSNDISASRAKALLKNIEVFGIGNVLITCEYPEKLVDYFGCFFDKILVDAPCSGEGMFRKDGKLIKSWETQGPEFFAPLQKNILENAGKMLKPGGYIVYSTCTFSKMEDEDNITIFLENNPEFSLEKIYDYEGFVRGFGINEAIRLFPHKLGGEGHFVALMKKNGISMPDEQKNFNKTPKLPAEFMDFIGCINRQYDLGSIKIINDKVYLMPQGVGELKGIRTLRTGLLMGEIKKERFEPSQALAMNLRMEDYNTVADLKADDINVIKYLKGETIELEEHTLTGSCKNVLICVDGYPLGWGRLNNLTVKNKYLPGWRIM